MPTPFADTRRNWSRSRRTSSWPPAARPWRRATGDPHRPDRVRRISPIRSAPALSKPGAAGRQRHRLHAISNTAMSGKWLELLKEIAPSVTRAAVLRDPDIGAGHRPICRHPGGGAVARGGAHARRRARRRRDRARLDRFARAPNGGLIVTAGGDGISSRSDHRACGPAQAARGLSLPLLTSPTAA